MNEEQRELFFDLLTKKAVYGLDPEEQGQLDMLDMGNAEEELRTLELTAAAISIAGLEINEPMPAHLYERIANDSARHLSRQEKVAVRPAQDPSPSAEIFTADEIFRQKAGSSWFGWLGWAAAAVACVALVVNIVLTRQQPTDVAKVPTQAEMPQIKTPSQMRDEMLASTADMVKANWSAGNVKEMKELSGDVVWSDEKQAGYMRFRGLPKNDGSKETYQLWIFDKTQDKATPIDGGTFDVTSEGEVVIPINAKLKARGTEMFAITIEKPGGVVVSKREKIAALAKVEAKPGSPA